MRHRHAKWVPTTLVAAALGLAPVASAAQNGLNLGNGNLQGLKNVDPNVEIEHDYTFEVPVRMSAVAPSASGGLVKCCVEFAATETTSSVFSGLDVDKMAADADGTVTGDVCGQSDVALTDGEFDGTVTVAFDHPDSATNRVPESWKCRLLVQGSEHTGSFAPDDEPCLADSGWPDYCAAPNSDPLLQAEGTY